MQNTHTYIITITIYKQYNLQQQTIQIHTIHNITITTKHTHNTKQYQYIQHTHN